MKKKAKCITSKRPWKQLNFLQQKYRGVSGIWGLIYESTAMLGIVAYVSWKEICYTPSERI